jgi:hypothetical protein
MDFVVLGVELGEDAGFWLCLHILLSALGHCVYCKRQITNKSYNYFPETTPLPPVHLQYQLSQSIINNNCNSSLIYICQIYSNCYPFVQQAIVAIGLFTYSWFPTSTNWIVQHNCITTGLVFQLISIFNN